MQRVRILTQTSLVVKRQMRQLLAFITLSGLSTPSLSVLVHACVCGNVRAHYSSVTVRAHYSRVGVRF